MHLHAVGRAEDHRPGRDHGGDGEVRGHLVRAQRRRLATLNGHHRGQRRGARAGRHQGDGRVVGGDHRRPAQAFARGQVGHAGPVHGHAKDVAPLEVVPALPHVAGEDQETVVGRDADLLRHPGVRRQQHRFAARCGDRVEVRPAVQVGQEDQPVAGAPLEVRPAVAAGHRAPQCGRALPDAAALPAGGIGRPDRPGARVLIQHRLGRAAASGRAHEGQVRAIGRPARAAVPARARRQPEDGRERVSEDADEGVVAAGGDEGEARAVGGPDRVGALAPGEEHAPRRRRAVQRHGPDRTVPDERHDAPWPDDGFVALGQQPRRRAAVEGHRPDLHLRLQGRARRVGGEVALGGEVAVVVAAPDVDQGAPIRGEAQVRQLLAVVGGVGRDPARRPAGGFRRPDVARPALVKNPGDAVAGGSGHRSQREGRALDLLQGEGGGVGGLRAGGHRPGRRRDRALRRERRGREGEDGRERAGRGRWDHAPCPAGRNGRLHRHLL